MSTHRQQQQSDQEQKRTWFSRRNVVIATIVIVASLITTAWILSILNVISATWAYIITAVVTVAGVVFTFVAAFPSLLHAETPGQSKTPSSSSQLQGTPDSLSSPDPAVVQQGIAGLPPPTNPRTIQPRAKEVQEIYAPLTQDDTTALLLTGIGGAGKSTLAALVFEYAEKQRIDGQGPFMAEALWLRVDAAAEIGMTDLMGNLMEAPRKANPNIGRLTPANQAAALFNALNTTEKARLVILDHFKNFLNSQTGTALPA